MKPLAPYVAHSDTSRAAAAFIAPDTNRLRSLVLAEIRQHPLTGRTCDEVEAQTGLSHQTASARIRELSQRGDIVATGARRPTRSGRMAAVYVTKEAAR